MLIMTNNNKANTYHEHYQDKRYHYKSKVSDWLWYTLGSQPVISEQQESNKVSNKPMAFFLTCTPRRPKSSPGHIPRKFQLSQE